MDLTTLCGIATDGGCAVSGPGIGLAGLLMSALRGKGISDNIAIFHCHYVIHQENLFPKSLKYKQVIGPVTKAINFIRARGLNPHQDLLYFTEVCWLSKGRNFFLGKAYLIKIECFS